MGMFQPLSVMFNWPVILALQFWLMESRKSMANPFLVVVN